MKNHPELTEILQLIWYDPAVGYLPGEQLWDVLPREVRKLTTKREVVEWVDNQQTRQVFRRNRITRFRPIIAEGPGELQVDLADFGSYKEYQRAGERWMLVVIDIYTRKLWTRALKTKGDKDVRDGLVSVFKQFDRDTKAVGGSWPSVRRMTTDAGPEFTNKTVERLLDSRGIELYVAPPEDKARQRGGQVTGVVDRVIRTIRRLLNHVWNAQSTREWVSILPSITLNYNNRRHSTLGAPPNEIWDGTKTPKARRVTVEGDVLAPGTRVRHVKTRGRFDKAGKEFTKNVFTVKEKIGNRYVLMKSGDELKTRYRDYELQVVDDTPDLPPPPRDLPPDAVKQRKASIRGLKQRARTERRVRAAGVDRANIVAAGRQRRQTARLDL